MKIQHAPIAETGMLIRKPVSEVFEAFVNPDITSRFWFTKGSGRLQEGSQKSALSETGCKSCRALSGLGKIES